MGMRVVFRERRLRIFGSPADFIWCALGKTCIRHHEHDRAGAAMTTASSKWQPECL